MRTLFQPIDQGQQQGGTSARGVTSIPGEDPPADCPRDDRNADANGEFIVPGGSVRVNFGVKVNYSAEANIISAEFLGPATATVGNMTAGDTSTMGDGCHTRAEGTIEGIVPVDIAIPDSRVRFDALVNATLEANKMREGPNTLPAASVANQPRRPLSN